MKLTLNSLYLSVLMAMTPSVLASEAYPIEFADFFIEHEDIIQVTIVGAKEYVAVPSLVTYDSFRLKSKDEEIQSSVRQYLKRESLKSAEIDKILASLTVGVEANPGCDKALDQCVPADVVGAAEYVFDFDNKVLKIFVSSDMLEKQVSTKKYHGNRNDNQAVILSTDVSGFLGESSNSSVTVSNDLIAGLTYGHITAETQYSTSDSEFDVYEANYHLERDNVKGVVGYQQYRNPTLNSADFLGNGMDLSGYSLTVGSSDNLVVGKNSALRTLNFFSTTSGRLEIKQNERVLVSRNIEAGQQSVGYDELPTGIYNVTITVTQGDNVSVSEVRQVVNTSRFDLAVKDWDYQVQAGYLDTEVSKYDFGLDISGYPIKSPEVEDSSRYFGRASSTYRIQENLMVGAGVTANNDDTHLQAALKLALSDWAEGEVTLSQFASGGNAQYASLTVAPFFVSYNTNDFDVKESSLAHLLYGEQATTEWNLGVSGELFGGSAYLNYLSIEGTDDFNRFHSENLSASWSKMAFGGVLSLNANYALNDDYGDQWTTNLMWTVHFNDNTYGSFTGSVNGDGYSETRSALTYSEQLENGSISSTAGVTLGENGVESELSVSANGESSYARYGGYGYLTDSGSYSISGNLSTTQVFTEHGVMSTPDKGESYISIAPEWKGKRDKDADSHISYYMSSDNGYKRKSDFSGKESELIRLTKYTETELDLDGDMANIEIEKGSMEGFSLPGSVFVLDSTLIALQSQMFVVSDINDQPLDQLRCFGPGCKTVERLSDDGVFRVNYRDQTPFALVSDKKMCVFDIDAVGSHYVHAYCLPGLENPYAMESGENGIEKGETEDLMLIGRYEFNAESAKLIERLGDVNLNSKVIQVGKASYIYISAYTDFTTEQQMLLDGLKVYAMHDNANNDNLFSAR
ncbi:TcfC E-set like domain-containing protein [Vibrio owensii]|uniref:TcfC E-set like domain-containing protein n=1 Tax=Vibrio owensii TaxID=696485 RepID=UPI003CE560F6